MASTTSDAGQQKLLQNFSSPGCQAVHPSLRDEEALSVSGESTDTAIWISDSDDSDTEDENDVEGQDLDNSQSCCTTPTTTSIADHLDNTGTKHSATESEAAVPMDTTPAVSAARVADDLTWTRDSNMDPLPDSELNQQSPCQTNRTSAGDATACTDASLDVSPTSLESQPYLGVSDEQLVTEVTGATSEPDIMMVDALSDEGSCHRVQSTPAPTSMCTYSAVAATPKEMAQTLLNSSEVCASTSPDDATPGAHTSSSAGRLSPESQQEQDIDHTSCGSSDAEPESSEAESGSPFGARVSPPTQELPSRRRSRRRSSHAHETVQDTDSDVDTEGSGSEDGLDVRECVRDEDYCPSPPKAQGHGSGDDSDDEQHGRKRHKASRSHCSVRSIPTSARSSHREMRSTRAAAHAMRKRGTSAYRVLSSTSSQASSVSSEASAFLARFQEWPLENVSMKRITENGKTTFQFQFEWPLCTNHPPVASVIPDSTGSVATKKTTKRSPARRAKYSDDENNFLVHLKEIEQLRWAEIRRRFAQRFPGRGGSGLQVHYCTKLKDRGRT